MTDLHRPHPGQTTQTNQGQPVQKFQVQGWRTRRGRSLRLQGPIGARHRRPQVRPPHPGRRLRVLHVERHGSRPDRVPRRQGQPLRGQARRSAVTRAARRGALPGHAVGSPAGAPGRGRGARHRHEARR